eukprot:CAMPEP_0170082540 /NCGR_PEP_ID=MMETSP0019_2-20121128/18096_1 /TAXON_ID=98059 /ORGANISM="Dinobryon sp., Strain UTEXLB2267" /LENGTH=158 /DNA_ID=CAMNT_0010297449 /DNA_START=34 /DNA_END=513 /DNA_ORIENTATION=+
MANPWGRRIPDLSDKELTIDQKTWLANRVINRQETANELSLKTKISVFTLYKWIRIIKSGAKLSENGRQRIIAQEHLPKIEDFLTNSKTSIAASPFEDEVHKYAVLTAQNRKGISEAQVQRPSRRTLGRIEEQLNIKTGNAEIKNRRKKNKKPAIIER